MGSGQSPGRRRGERREVDARGAGGKEGERAFGGGCAARAHVVDKEDPLPRERGAAEGAGDVVWPRGGREAGLLTRSARAPQHGAVGEAEVPRRDLGDQGRLVVTAREPPQRVQRDGAHGVEGPSGARDLEREARAEGFAEAPRAPELKGSYGARQSPLIGAEAEGKGLYARGEQRGLAARAETRSAPGGAAAGGATQKGEHPAV